MGRNNATNCSASQDGTMVTPPLWQADVPINGRSFPHYGLKHHWQIAAFVWLETALYTLQSAETELEAAHKDKANAPMRSLMHWCTSRQRCGCCAMNDKPLINRHRWPYRKSGHISARRRAMTNVTDLRQFQPSISPSSG
jgi:hypothetical protein